MARKRKEQWVSGREATAILRRNSGRDDIQESYLRLLAKNGKIESRAVDGRTNEYLLSDVEDYVVRRRGKKQEQEQELAQDQQEPVLV